MFQINGKKFAAGLTYGKTSNGTTDVKNKLLIFLRENSKFTQIYVYESSFLTKFDCDAISDAGFIAVVNTVKSTDVTQPDQLVEIGSFIIRITLEASGKPKVEVLQKIALLNQNGVTLWSRSEKLYLVYSYNTFTKSPLTICTVYQLAGTNFMPLDDLPCQNARVIEFFTVHHNLMVLIGNYRENNGTTNTFSTVMRYDLDQKRFIDHQKIASNAIAVGRYFFLDHQNQRQHFLFIGNTFEINEFGLINYDVPSMIYKFANGFFIPMQTISVKQIKAVLPIIVSFKKIIHLDFNKNFSRSRERTTSSIFLLPVKIAKYKSIFTMDGSFKNRPSISPVTHLVQESSICELTITS